MLRLGSGGFIYLGVPTHSERPTRRMSMRERTDFSGTILALTFEIERSLASFT
jgi:hypothetical protein